MKRLFARAYAFQRFLSWRVFLRREACGFAYDLGMAILYFLLLLLLAVAYCT